MKDFLKVLYIIIESAVFLGFVAFAYSNLDKTVEYTCPIMQKVYTTQLNLFAFVVLAGGYAAGYALCCFVKSNMANMCSAYQKRSENISIASESDKASIAALQAKIETLETALKSALDNK